MAEVNREEYLIPVKVPVAALEVKAAWENLSRQEKKYAHHISQASWWGSLIVLEQVSPESKAIFELFLRLFKADSPEALRKAAVEAGVSDEDFTALENYVTVFFTNMGNYYSFGDRKFIPRISVEDVGKIIQCSSSDDKKVLESLFEEAKDAMYSLDERVQILSYENSAYYSANVTKEDIKAVSEAMQAAGISHYNTRLFKEDDGQLVLRIAAAEETEGKSLSLSDDRIVQVRYGDYDGKLQRVVDNLAQAQQHAANEHEEKMMGAYVAHFRGGDINDHKEAQKHWIKDIGPVVECNIGFIESYRDPSGGRGEFEGFVAVVNKQTSAVFAKLVDGATTYLPKLPWDAAYEKDQFTKPDFTSLEVITFAGSGIPAGINIPNYDDIRQNHGFKNVSLGNVLSAHTPKEAVTFLADEDQEIFQNLKTPSFHVQVGLHELLGHGSGKLFVEDEKGNKNFDNVINPFTNEPVTSWYTGGQTYDTVFGSIGSSLEECRAECVGIYLSADYELLTIFGHESKQEQEDICYVNWLNMCRAGLMALQYYSPKKQAWGQAHMQARYAILQTLLQAGEGLVTLDISEDNVIVRLDRTKIHSVGVPAIGDFLNRIQVCKSTADFKGASELYSRTDVSDEFLALRAIVLAKKKPRPQFVQVHTYLNDAGEVELQEFPATTAGVIESICTRFAEL